MAPRGDARAEKCANIHRIRGSGRSAHRAMSVNMAGTIARFYVDSGRVYHGFVRADSGAITTFDAPGAGTGPNSGTTALSINAGGAKSTSKQCHFWLAAIY
jgi:hypothetical protein